MIIQYSEIHCERHLVSTIEKSYTDVDSILKIQIKTQQLSNKTPQHFKKLEVINHSI